MIIRSVKTYLTAAAGNRYKSATRTVSTSSSSSSSLTNHKRSIPSTRFAGPTTAAFACRLSYAFCRPTAFKNLFPELRIDGRQYTMTLIAVNVLGYLAQRASGGKLLHLGAMTNDLIRNRQFWRLVTSSFLHANVGQLMASCYSLYTLGPGVEVIYGPRRYLSVYITSAIAGSGTSHWLCKSATVGASGAIFGLIGSYVMYISGLPGVEDSEDEDEKERITSYWSDVFDRIAIDSVAGMLYKGADRWGNVGGLIGGAAVSWLVGSTKVIPLREKNEHGSSLIKRDHMIM